MRTSPYSTSSGCRYLRISGSDPVPASWKDALEGSGLARSQLKLPFSARTCSSTSMKSAEGSFPSSVAVPILAVSFLTICVSIFSCICALL